MKNPFESLFDSPFESLFDSLLQFIDLHFTGNAFALFWMVLILGLYVAFFAARKRRERETRDRLERSTAEEPIIGTAADRERAEAEVASLPSNYAEHLAKTHVMIERLPTIDGFDNAYMNELLDEMRAKGIECDSVFHGLPLGVATGITEPHGAHDLYVVHDQVDSAREFLARRFKRA